MATAGNRIWWRCSCTLWLSRLGNGSNRADTSPVNDTGISFAASIFAAIFNFLNFWFIVCIFIKYVCRRATNQSKFSHLV